MKRVYKAVFGGTVLSLALAAGTHAFAASGTESTMPPAEAPGNALDMTPAGSTGVAHRYAIEPVPQGQLKLKEGQHAEVRNKEGKAIGKLEKTIVDTKTKKPEYGVVSLSEENNRLVAIPWSAIQFDREKGNATLKMNRPELDTYISSEDAKDLTPDIKKLVKEMQSSSSGQTGGASGR